MSGSVVPMIDEAERAALLERLRRTAGRSHQPRWARGLAQPWRSVYVKFLRATGTTREVGARTFFGPTMTVVLPEHVSCSIWRYGFVEADVCHFLLAVLPPGGRFIDVGAHYGFFTLFGAHLVGTHGRVLAIEPTPHTHGVLSRNVARYAHVTTCRCAAFSDERDLAMRDFGIELSAYNSAVGTRAVGGRPQEARLVVPARRIDGLVADQAWEAVDVIKIDAELAEAEILRGAEQTLLTAHPAVILEVGDFDAGGGQRSRQVIDWLEARGYGGFEVQDGALVLHHKRLQYDYANLLFAAGTLRASLTT